jgi:putative Ca2+/H+ antiporter (TMEM165/GDT1 family)
MDWSLFATVFSTVFFAELGDKTQFATLLYAADADNPKLTIFVASATALVATTAIGVGAGNLIGRHLSQQAFHWVAGLGFIAVGVWTILRA